MILDGKGLAKTIKEKIKNDIEEYGSQVPPQLVTIKVGNNPASAVYVRNKVKACEQCGIDSKVIELPEDVTPDELEEIYMEHYADVNVSGIIIQLPVPKHLMSTVEKLTKEAVAADADGFSPTTLGALMMDGAHTKERTIPATPLGILRLIDHYGIETEGKNVVVIGRSNIVGKPIALLLMNKPYNANVTVLHSKTSPEDMHDYLMKADIIIAAVGVPNFIKECKPGAVLIDVGINRTEDGKLVGDIDESIKVEPQSWTPVPGGVGPMTVAALMENTYKLWIP